MIEQVQLSIILSYSFYVAQIKSVQVNLYIDIFTRKGGEKSFFSNRLINIPSFKELPKKLLSRLSRTEKKLESITCIRIHAQPSAHTNIQLYVMLSFYAIYASIHFLVSYLSCWIQREMTTNNRNEECSTIDRSITIANKTCIFEKTEFL